MTDWSSQDEALELSGGPGGGATPEAALDVMLKYASLAVVTLGERGCIAKRHGDAQLTSEPAAKGITVHNSTTAFLPACILQPCALQQVLTEVAVRCNSV